jgi:lysophospholipase L1-like esterase
MGGLKSMAEWQKYGLAQKDKVHFTKKGYELIGDKFYNALIQFYLDTIE